MSAPNSCKIIQFAYLEYLHQYHLVWVSQVDLVLGADEARDLLDDGVGLEDLVVPNIVSDGVLQP